MNLARCSFPVYDLFLSRKTLVKKTLSINASHIISESMFFFLFFYDFYSYLMSIFHARAMYQLYDGIIVQSNLRQFNSIPCSDTLINFFSSIIFFHEIKEIRNSIHEWTSYSIQHLIFSLSLSLASLVYYHLFLNTLVLTLFLFYQCQCLQSSLATDESLLIYITSKSINTLFLFSSGCCCCFAR